MTQALQNQPFAKLKTVTRCTASYVRENDKLKRDVAAYIEFCNSLFFSIDPTDERLIKLKKKLGEG